MFSPARSSSAHPLGTTSPPKNTDRTLRAILLLAVIALGSIWSLLPTAEEKAAGLIDDGRHADAVALLEAARVDGPLSVYQSQMLLKLYVLTKDPSRATSLLSGEPALQATRLEAMGHFASLFREARGYAGEAPLLGLVYEIGGSGRDLLRLRLLQRLLGNTKADSSLLVQATSDDASTPAYWHGWRSLSGRPQQQKVAELIAPSRDLAQVPNASPQHDDASPNTPPFSDPHASRTRS